MSARFTILNVANAVDLNAKLILNGIEVWGYAANAVGICAIYPPDKWTSLTKWGLSLDNHITIIYHKIMNKQKQGNATGAPNNTIIIFIIQAYVERNDQGQLSDVVTIELIDTNPDHAIERAKKLIDRPYFRIASIIEKERGDHGHN